jgi:hypothetical protein
MAIKISFSRYCIGKGSEESNRKPCGCKRCLTLAGKEVTEYTELKAAVHSTFQKYELDESVTNILPKTLEDQLKWERDNIKDLIQNLQWILNPPVFEDEDNLVKPNL